MVLVEFLGPDLVRLGRARPGAVRPGPGGFDGPRKPVGSLPQIAFMRPEPRSRRINAGSLVELPFNGTASDPGAFEVK